jgi:hypothetical protein
LKNKNEIAIMRPQSSRRNKKKAVLVEASSRSCSAAKTKS